MFFAINIILIQDSNAFTLSASASTKFEASPCRLAKVGFTATATATRFCSSATDFTGVDTFLHSVVTAAQTMATLVLSSEAEARRTRASGPKDLSKDSQATFNASGATNSSILAIRI